MNAGFSLEVPVGIIAFDRESNAFDAGLFTRLIFKDLFPIAAAITPANIHAQKNLRPVLRFRTTGAWVKTDNRVTAVIRITEQLSQLGLRDFARYFGELRRRFI
jgi:midasin (ATPase involved in ribosome maturation)